MCLDHTLELLVPAAAVTVEHEERAVYNDTARARPNDYSSLILANQASKTRIFECV